MDTRNISKTTEKSSSSPRAAGVWQIIFGLFFVFVGVRAKKSYLYLPCFGVLPVFSNRSHLPEKVWEAKVLHRSHLKKLKMKTATIHHTYALTFGGRTVRLTPISNPVPGYQEFLVTPSETIVCRAGQKNKKSYLGHGWAMIIGWDMFGCRLLNKLYFTYHYAILI